jgi:uncharacterized membrane protein
LCITEFVDSTPQPKAPDGAPSMISAFRAREKAALDQMLRARRTARDPNKIYADSLTFGQRVADNVASTMGSWRFIIVQSAILAAWLALNISEIIFHAWDPYPFILLNLVLSFQAAYSAPIIMMSQNRQSAKDRMQAELDLNTDLKAEILIEELHGSMDDLRLDKWADLLNTQQRQIEMLQQVIKHLEAATAA